MLVGLFVSGGGYIRRGGGRTSASRCACRAECASAVSGSCSIRESGVGATARSLASRPAPRAGESAGGNGLADHSHSDNSNTNRERSFRSATQVLFSQTRLSACEREGAGDSREMAGGGRAAGRRSDIQRRQKSDVQGYCPGLAR